MDSKTDSRNDSDRSAHERLRNPAPSNPSPISQHYPHHPPQAQSQPSPSQLSPPPRPPPPTHKRTYQACIPCRQRKVRCDLGSVEAPHDPPCVRCRRESKDCYFSVTRRKRTPSVDIQPGMGRGRGLPVINQDDSGPFKRPRTLGPSEEQQYRSPDYGAAQQSPPYPQHPPLAFPQSIDPRLDIHGIRRPPPLQRLPQPPPPPPPTATKNTSDTLLQTEVYNSHEALMTLIEAAGTETPLASRKPDIASPSLESVNDSGRGQARAARDSAEHSRLQSPAAPGAGRWNQNVRFSSVQSDEGGASSHADSHARRKSVASAISPAMQTQRSQSASTTDDGMEKTLRAWSKFRFVKAGWFTAREAVSLVEYFYRHLHPLSPTLTSSTLLHVSHPRYHPLLLRYEPFLTTTILTVASRFMVLPGPGGKSRSYALHDMLWREIRGGFERLMWGGGWSDLGIRRQQSPSYDADNGAKTGRGLRTLGTVEGLLILSEWHVRGLNFPLDVEETDWGVDGISDDEDEDMDRSDRRDKSVVRADDGGVVGGLGELSSRSDHMSWMLLGNALALAYELGVFDEVEDTASGSATAVISEPALTPFRIRAQRMQKLLLVYVLQLASRLGWTSMIPSHLSQSVSNKITPVQTPSSTHSRGWSDDDELQEVVFSSWVDLTMLMKTSSDMLFPDRTMTKNIMRSGEYVTKLTFFQKELRTWKRRFDDHRLPSPICHILSMEYDHVRFYVNSLALQAVVDRCSLRAQTPTPTPFPQQQQNNNNYRTPSAASSAPTGGNRGLLKAINEIAPHDYEFIREVVDASRSLLTTVTEQMYPSGFLKHAPVRIYLRILSAAMFLLKTFALGEKEAEVKESLRCIDGAVTAMRGASVDDVTLGERFADLLEVLTSRVNDRIESLRIRPRRDGSRAGSPMRMEMEEEPMVNDAAPSIMPQQQPQQLPPHDIPHDELEQQQHGPEPIYDPNIGAWAPHSGGYENWLALPLDPIYGFEGVTSQGSMGVDVGGVDLLEILLAGGNGQANGGGHAGN